MGAPIVPHTYTVSLESNNSCQRKSGFEEHWFTCCFSQLSLSLFRKKSLKKRRKKNWGNIFFIRKEKSN